MIQSGCNVKIGAFLCVLTVLCVCRTAQAAKIPDEVLWRCVAGEAAGESLEGQTAVAEVILRRGGIKGVYGCKSTLWDKSSHKTQVKIKWACTVAENGSNLSKGATVWGNDSDIEKFKRTKWFQNMTKTVRIGAHSFYRDKTKVGKGAL